MPSVRTISVHYIRLDVHTTRQLTTCVGPGDFVDRGAWGLEVLMVLACWKLVYPEQVVILRGNHECTTCTHMYGFRGEVLAKYGPKHFKVYCCCYFALSPHMQTM